MARITHNVNNTHGTKYAIIHNVNIGISMTDYISVIGIMSVSLALNVDMDH